MSLTAFITRSIANAVVLDGRGSNYELRRWALEYVRDFRQPGHWLSGIWDSVLG